MKRNRTIAVKKGNGEEVAANVDTVDAGDRVELEDVEVGRDGVDPEEEAMIDREVVARRQRRPTPPPTAPDSIEESD